LPNKHLDTHDPSFAGEVAAGTPFVAVGALADKAADSLEEGSRAVAAAGSDPAAGSRPGRHVEGEGVPGCSSLWRT
jgi:hypothetical protein